MIGLVSVVVMVVVFVGVCVSVVRSNVMFSSDVFRNY